MKSDEAFVAVSDVAAVLASGVHRVPRKRQTDRHQSSCVQEHCVQLHSVSICVKIVYIAYTVLFQVFKLLK